ncbi:hypothetical protein GOP47_0000434 [Adiantum capillus-veneris]|uniref:CCHC-type domain-containing protein n=1 Tax=Adiantum capillus-veneris TaxID=13818 RepID=A0A9D4ZT30_ADICA|nr:hypothetical protein GOP47_0000434 [Adiantum capillus-veneris]
MGSHNRPCHRCGKSGHLARYCSMSTCFRCNGEEQERTHQISCHKCGRKGHIARFCNDPFAKAAEVERHERQQALASARTPGVNRGRDVRSFEKDQQSDRVLPIQSQVAAAPIDTKKRHAPNSVQSVVSRRLKIVGVKSDNGAQKLAQSTKSLKPTQISGASQWQGLVGYGSDDSDDDDGPGGAPG